nr:hypothetical protein [Enterovibrio nigricans]
MSDAQAFDYAGEPLFGDYHAPPAWYNASLVNETLSTGQGIRVCL